MDIERLMAEAYLRHSRGELQTEDEVKQRNKVQVEAARLAAQRPTPEEIANQEANQKLAIFWGKVATAMIHKNPEPNKRVVSMKGRQEMSRALGNSYPGHTRYNLAKKLLIPGIVMRHAIPAWDMGADFSRFERSSGESSRGDYFAQDRLYLDGTGLAQCRLVEEGNTGIFSGLRIIQPGDILKDVAPSSSPSSELHMYSGLQRYEEIAIGLTNLAAWYKLPIELK